MKGNFGLHLCCALVLVIPSLYARNFRRGELLNSGLPASRTGFAVRCVKPENHPTRKKQTNKQTVRSRSKQRLTCHRSFIQRQLQSRGVMKRSPKLGQPELEFSGVMFMPAGAPMSHSNSDIGALLPIAPWGRSSL
jgi:hypothetical protein